MIIFKSCFGNDNSGGSTNNGGYNGDNYVSDNGNYGGNNNDDYYDDNYSNENNGNDSPSTNPLAPKLEELSIDPYPLKNTTIKPYNKADTTISDASFKYYSGTISQKAQEDTYSFTTIEAGIYRIELSDMVSGFKVSMYLYDSNGSRVDYSSSISQGSGVTVTLNANSTYKLVIKYSSGTGSYKVFIGQQKTTTNITNYTTIYDSIEFKGQQNNYSFTPSVSGVYRFYIAQINSGIKVSMYVYDDAGYRVDYNSGIGQNSGVTVTLEAGKTYSLQIKQSSNTGDYALAVGYQKETTNISNYDIVSDSIQFSGQENNYTYTPTKSGNYTFQISDIVSGTKVSIYIYDSAGYRVDYNTGMSSGSTLKVNLTANSTYSVVVKQSSGDGNYTISISN